MIVTLTQPISIGGDWDDQYYDATHNHLLCFQENKVYLLSLEDVNPTPVEIYKLPPNLSTKILLIKISMNKELIAAQVTSTTILVMDIQSDKRWKIDIRGNKILDKGIIWSDHGGNSEDLVIITNKGLELYKVNNRKGYCRLSRNLNQSIINYWYNIETRMILLASNKNPPAKSNNSSNSNKELLIMDGYFLKSEKPNIPMLELPPPDKIPRFELGPGVDMKCIHLINVYGKLLILVRYMIDHDAYYAVYQITKTSVDKLFSLALGNMSTNVVISTYDNLIICHDLSTKLSIVFDLLKTPRDRVSRASSIIIDAIVPSAVIGETCRFVEEEMALAGNRNNARKLSISKHSDEETHQAIFGGKISGIPQLKQADTIPFVGSTDNLPNYSHDEDVAISLNRTNVEIKNLRFDYVEIEEPRPCYPFYSSEVFDWYSPSLAYDFNNKVIWKITCKFDLTCKLIDDYREKLLFLSRRGRKYYYLKPTTLLNNTNSNNNGTNTNTPPQSLTTTVSHESQIAKINLLRILSDTLEEKVSLPNYISLFYGMNNSYILESYRYYSFKGYKLLNMNQDIDIDIIDYFQVKFLISTDFFSSNGSSTNNGIGSNGTTTPGSNGNVSGGALVKPIVPSVKRQSIGEKVFQSVMMNRQRNDSLLVLDVDAPTEIEALEPNEQNILPSVSVAVNVICSQAKAQIKTLKDLTKLLSPSPDTPRPPQPPAKLEKQYSTVRLDSYPLHTRRDEKGDLIVTQTEVLMYVWIPILLNPHDTIDYNYCCDVLTLYIASIIDQGIAIIPSILYLHLQLLFALERYQDIINFLGTGNVYPDSIIIARSLLDFATILEEGLLNIEALHKLGNHEKEEDSNNALEFRRLQSECIERFRKYGLDMLWKVGEYTTIVKTYLLQGKIFEAIEVCHHYIRYNSASITASLSNDESTGYRSNLLTSTISGTEFYIATLQLLDEEQRMTAAQKERRGVRERSEEEKIQLLYAVYSFIVFWDKTLLERSAVRIVVKLFHTQSYIISLV